MSDDKTNRGPRDRARINLHEDYKVEYWTKELGVSQQELADAVGRAGSSAGAVRQELGKAHV